MESNTSHVKTYVVDTDMIEIVRHLLSDGWRKKSAQVFFLERNHYILEIDGRDNPLWQLSIKPKTKEFDENDWKLLKDLKKLNNLGDKRRYFKRLYVNDGNKREILALIAAMKSNNFNLIFDNNYIVFRTRSNKIKVFKIAAAMDLSEQPDGWYAGQKRIL